MLILILILSQIASLMRSVHDRLTLRGIALDVFCTPVDYDPEYE